MSSDKIHTHQHESPTDSSHDQRFFLFPPPAFFAPQDANWKFLKNSQPDPVLSLSLSTCRFHHSLSLLSFLPPLIPVIADGINTLTTVIGLMPWIERPENVRHFSNPTSRSDTSERNAFLHALCALSALCCICSFSFHTSPSLCHARISTGIPVHMVAVVVHVLTKKKKERGGWFAARGKIDGRRVGSMIGSI